MNLEGRDSREIGISRVEIARIMAKNDDFITLKEAAELSGYSADYVGQLIRQGKIPGKQIFSNVAWMTTEVAVREYIAQKGKVSNSRYGAYTRFKELYSSPEKVVALARVLLWGAIVVFSVATLLLLFVFAIGIDQRLEDRSLQYMSYGE